MLTRSITRKLSTAKAFQKTTILNDLTKKLFILKLNNANSDAATVSYEKDKDVYVLIESFIPETLRGQGLGKILAKKTFDYIVENNGKMKLECEFLQKCYNENPGPYKGHVLN